MPHNPCTILEFTPLEFETELVNYYESLGGELEFTPLEFETIC